MYETRQQQSNTNTCTFQVFREVWFSLKVAAIEDKGHITIQAQNDINANTCTFQVFHEVWFSMKVAAIEDKGHLNRSTNNINTNTCTFRVFQELVQPEGSCNRRQGSYHNTSTK